MVEIARIESLVELASIASSWNELVESSRQILPTSSYAWISSYFEHRLKDGERWLCYLAYRKQELAGILPLVVMPAAARLGGKRIERLPSSPHTVSVDLVCSSEACSEVISRLVHTAIEDQPEAAGIEFSRIPENSSVLSWLRRGVGVPLHTIEWDGDGAYLSTEGPFDGYEAQLSASFRQDQGRHSRQIGRLPGYFMQTLKGANALPGELNRFMKIEAANWKGRAGTAILTSEPLRAYYATLVQKLYDCGWLRWEFMEADSGPIAGQLSVQVGSRLILWKPAYDVRYERLSPGTVLMHTLIRSAFEDPEIDELNLLSDYPYYAKWRVSLRPYYNVRLYSRTPLALISYYLPVRLRMGLRRIPFLARVAGYVKALTRKART